MGNIVTKNEVHRFSLKEKGQSTLGGRQVWFDPDVLRLNFEGRGSYLGEFGPTDQVLVVLKNGEYYTSSFDASNHYEDNILRIERFRPKHVWTAVVRDAAQQGYPYLKRFQFEASAKKQSFIGDNPKSELIALSDAPGARFDVDFGGSDSFRGSMIIDAIDFIAVKSLRAKGKRITNFEVASITETEPRQIKETPEQETASDYQEKSVDKEIADIDEGKSEDEVRDELTGQQRIF